MQNFLNTHDMENRRMPFPVPTIPYALFAKETRKKATIPKKKNSDSLNLCGTKFEERETV